MADNNNALSEIETIAIQKLENTINDIAYMFQNHVGAKTGDISPDQETLLDKYKSNILGLLEKIAIQNIKADENIDDEIFLEIIDDWQKDDETSTSYAIGKNGDHFYTYIYNDDVKFPEGIKTYTGNSWKEIFEQHYKEQILEYIQDCREQSDYIAYWNDEQKALLNKMVDQVYGTDTKSYFGDDQNSLDFILNHYHNGIVLFNNNETTSKEHSIGNILRGIANVNSNKKLYSIEESVNDYVDEAVQLNINYDCGFDYPNAIKQVLRHEPEILVIDDLKLIDNVAKKIVQAANLGTLVFVGTDEDTTEKALDKFTGLLDDDMKKNAYDLLIGETIGFNDELSEDNYKGKEL